MSEAYISTIKKHKSIPPSPRSLLVLVEFLVAAPGGFAISHFFLSVENSFTPSSSCEVVVGGGPR